MNEYKNTYKGFFILLAIFVLSVFGVSFLTYKVEFPLVLFICNIMTIWVAILAYVIYKTGYIYWYTGVLYEDALAATPANREKYARKHLVRFAAFAVVNLVFSVIAYFTDMLYIVPILFSSLGLVIVAISTVNIKLELK